MAAEEAGPQRLQKVLAAAGVASRRVCEEMIVAGRVAVNGRPVTVLGSRVDPLTDSVEVDGEPININPNLLYVIYNKPKGVISSMMDEHGRPDLSAVASNFSARLFNVGRLDADTTGLMLLTNDGKMTQILAHPTHRVFKTYVALVRGEVAPQTVRQLHQGVELEDGLAQADLVRVLDRGSRTLMEITLHSGRNRVVRRMLSAVGHEVIDLCRTRLGPLHLRSLGSGRYRKPTKKELAGLLRLADRQPDRKSGRPGCANHPDRTGRRRPGV